MALGPILDLSSTSLGLFLANFGGPFGSVSSPVCAGRSPWVQIFYFFEAVTGQQKCKMRINLNFVCNRVVFLGFVSPKVLTFTFLLHFASTKCEKSKHLDKQVLLHTIYLAAAAGRSPLQYAAASRKPAVRCRDKGWFKFYFAHSFSCKAS